MISNSGSGVRAGRPPGAPNKPKNLPIKPFVFVCRVFEDLEAAGMHVDYDAGRISLPNKDTINMDKTARTWRIKLASPDAQVNISKDQHPHVAL